MNNEKKTPVRQIKFRGLRVDGKGLVYGDLKRSRDNRRGGTWHYIWVDTDDIEEDGEYVQVLPHTVGQFAGLLDKNGKEIYEGDIMINPNHKCGKKMFSVEWNVGGYHARYFEQGNYTLCLYPVLGEFEGCEVIGNIHENKKEG